MRPTRLLGLLSVLAVVAWALGAVVSLVQHTFGGESVLAAAVVTALLVVSVVAMSGVGARSKRWLENPDYYW